jgi:hypothetical protein
MRTPPAPPRPEGSSLWRRPASLCVVRVVLSALRYHWSAVPLALAAVVLLVPDTAMRHVTAIMNGRGGDAADSEAWLRGQIARLTGQLDTT